MKVELHKTKDIVVNIINGSDVMIFSGGVEEITHEAGCRHYCTHDTHEIDDLDVGETIYHFAKGSEVDIIVIKRVGNTPNWFSIFTDMLPFLAMFMLKGGQPIE